MTHFRRFLHFCLLRSKPLLLITYHGKKYLVIHFMLTKIKDAYPILISRSFVIYTQPPLTTYTPTTAPTKVLYYKPYNLFYLRGYIYYRGVIEFIKGVSGIGFGKEILVKSEGLILCLELDFLVKVVGVDR